MTPSSPDVSEDQQGAYAIEFALAFVVLFMVLYAILTYGFIFMAQQSLNRAANTGARSLLAWQDASNATARIQAATNQIDTFASTGWIRRMANLGARRTGALQVAICLQGRAAEAQVDPTGICNHFAPAADEPAQDAATTSAWVVVRYAYAQAPLIPILGAGPLALPVPDTLQAEARVDLGASYPNEPEAQ